MKNKKFAIPKGMVTIFDGATGTMLQRRGLKVGELPELLNVTDIDVIESIHREYLEAGADIVSSNTFGVNRFKAEKAGHTVEELTAAAVRGAKRAADSFENKYVALDIGPCGRMMKPAGSLPFNEAVDVFSEVIRAGDAAGADLILLETFTDLYELKAAVIAAKENSSLPIIATMSFEACGSTVFGATAEAMVVTLEGLGVDALGVNCSLGPKQLVPVVDRILAASSIPVLVQPNAGLPVLRDEGVSYDVTPEEFADYQKQFAIEGAELLGGCCGTDPGYIRLMKKMVEGVMPCRSQKAGRTTCICSPTVVQRFDDVVIIGERLNPTGKKTLQAAIRSGDMDFILSEAVRQKELGAAVLDVNMGLPDIDEPAALERAVAAIQAVVDLPLQLDSSNPEALERAARIYNGKPLINSVNGKEDSLSLILPIAKKYGAAVLGLTLDENGIPENAEKRLAIARRIVERAEALGIKREDILIDCLTMTASVQQEQAAETLRALRMVKDELGVKTVLGVSNISFGLPARSVINRTMLAMALMQGLDAPIMDPSDVGMSETIAAFRLLSGRDVKAVSYIKRFANAQVDTGTKRKERTLKETIINGLTGEAGKAADKLLETADPLAVIENEIIPALDVVGRDYETGRSFLPQLLQSADAAKTAFDRIRASLAKRSETRRELGSKIVLATVQGDIHDIGKNIVKVIMENYGFDVIDLGSDVPPGAIVRAVKESGAGFVGLSALMTTTVVSMKKAIALLRRECPGVKVIAGGAVLTEELAHRIGADAYAKDAMDGVRLVRSQ